VLDWLRGLFGGAGNKPQQEPRRKRIVAPAKLGPQITASWLQLPALAPGEVVQEIHGEASYQRNILALLDQAPGWASGRWSGLYVTAELIREPRNRHDRNAVRVDAGGQTVGYLPRGDAPRFHAVLRGLRKEGRRASARALVVGMGGNYGVKLLLADCDPTPATGEEPFLPGPLSVALVEEEKHQQALLAAKGELAELSVDGAEVVAFGHGERLGRLTDKMCARYLEVVAGVQEAGFPCTARLTVERGKRKWEGFVHMPQHGGLLA
tara:strand:+ start:368 stop:1165 length:798 start_codon:yes stop_codon:yes gene_type:complete